MNQYQPIHWYFVIGVSFLLTIVLVSVLAFWYYLAIFAPMELNIRRQMLNKKILNALEIKYCSNSTYENAKIKRYCESLK